MRTILSQNEYRTQNENRGPTLNMRELPPRFPTYAPQTTRDRERAVMISLLVSQRGLFAMSLVFRLFFVSVLAFAALPVAAQVATAELTGLVADQSGAGIPQAKITVTNLATKIVAREVTTLSDGSYVITLLPPGMYTINVEASGFRINRRQTDVAAKKPSALAVAL